MDVSKSRLRNLWDALASPLSVTEQFETCKEENVIVTEEHKAFEKSEVSSGAVVETTKFDVCFSESDGLCDIDGFVDG